MWNPHEMDLVGIAHAAEASEIEAMRSGATVADRIRDFEKCVLASQRTDGEVAREMIWHAQAARVNADIQHLRRAVGCASRESVWINSVSNLRQLCGIFKESR